MANFDEIKHLIVSGLNDESAEVMISDLTGGSDHLGIHITSKAFEGLALIKQHQLIMDILREKLKEEIHAVQIKTKKPQQG